MKSWKQLSIRLKTNSVVYCFGFFQEKFFWKLFLGSIRCEVWRGS